MDAPSPADSVLTGSLSGEVGKRGVLACITTDSVAELEINVKNVKKVISYEVRGQALTKNGWKWLKDKGKEGGWMKRSQMRDPRNPTKVYFSPVNYWEPRVLRGLAS